MPPDDVPPDATPSIVAPSDDAPLAELLGDGSVVPTLAGRPRRYVDLDHAATTRPLRAVWQRLEAVMPWYGSVHRGDGLLSRQSTGQLEKAVARVLAFSDGVPGQDGIYFAANTTAAINHLARRLELRDRPVVVCGHQHSSNLLPWKKHARVLHAAGSAGGFDPAALTKTVREANAALVVTSAASSITGEVTDTHAVAAAAHAGGARVFVDAAQLVAHRRLLRLPGYAAGHLDFVAYAGHKMYAPFGVAVLVGPAAAFAGGWPDQPGGGTVRFVNADTVVWADADRREQGGTPNFAGIVALAEACTTLDAIGFDAVRAHEAMLLAHAERVLGRIKGVTLFTPSAGDRVPVVPLAVAGVPYGLVAAYLGHECGVGVRAGTICQYELVADLLGLSDASRRDVVKCLEGGQITDERLGVVRASGGLTTTRADWDTLATSLADLIEHGPRGRYELRHDGTYAPFPASHSV